MSDLESTRRLKPAQIMAEARTWPPQQIEVFTAAFHQKTALVAQVNKAAARRQVRPLTPYPIYSAERGQWEHRVVRIKPAPPAWRRPLLISLAITATLGVLAGLGYWLLISLASLPLGLFLGVALVVMCVIVRAGRPPSVTVNNNINNHFRMR